MKQISELIDVKNASINASINAHSKNLATIDIDSILKEISLKINDPFIKRHVAFQKRSVSSYRLYDRQQIIIQARKSEIDKKEQEIIEKNKDFEVDSSAIFDIVSPIVLPSKTELLALKNHFLSNTLKNKDKISDLNDLINDFIATHNAYGKNVERIHIAYYENLIIYPMKYLKKVLNANFWQQNTLPTLSEIQQALKTIEGNKSLVFYAIANVQSEVSVDYNDDFFNDGE